MNRSVRLFIALVLSFCVLGQGKVRGQKNFFPVDRVNVLVGTQSSFELSSGNTYPVISRPWGMNSWTPQTGKMGDGWQYTYTANKIRGFKQTHQPSPWINDYGQFALMPVVGKNPKLDEEGRASWFSHKAEVARPYLYKVYLADYDTDVRLAPTERAAVMEIDYSANSNPEERWLVIDLFDGESHIEQVDDHTIVGYTTKNSGGVPEGFRCYFYLKSESTIGEFHSHSISFVGERLLTFKDGRAGQISAVRFLSAESKQTIRIASSFISSSQAEETYRREVAGQSLEEVAREGRAEWNRLMSRIEVDDAPERTTTFYSNLYRSMLFPRRFYEITPKGDTVHYSPYNGKVLPGYMYTDTGFWDTFRSLFPLVNLIFPEEGAKMQEGLMNAYRESGFFPEWASPGHRDCMVGNNSASVAADAFIKGLGRIKSKELTEALLKCANSVHPKISSTGRLGFDYYNKLGYIPCDVGIKESVARSLEYAYSDWCIYQVLRKTNAPIRLQKTYRERAMNYRHLYDHKSGWMRGKNIDGSWQSPFNPFKWGDVFTEGNALHYTWSVFHDIAGLIELMGGEKAFVHKLDSVFASPPIFDDSYYGFVIHEIREMQIMNMGNYAHGNQPIQHMIYLYNYAGRPDKTQYWIREVMNRLYSSHPDGYCGDEDNGQTSAWYVFSALGFYPVTPAGDQYVIGIPYFREVKLNLPNGMTTTIRAEQPEANYIKRVERNGQPYPFTFIKYQDLLLGGSYHFHLSNRPSSWGQDKSVRPYSFSTDI